MWWPFLLLLCPSNWTLTDCMGHLYLLVNSPFLFLCTKKNPLWVELPKFSRRKFVPGWPQFMSSVFQLLEVTEIQHLACAAIHALSGLHGSSHLSVTEHMLFIDCLAIDHSILCLKLIALWSSQGKFSPVLKAVFLTLANLTWFSTERNLIAADLLLGMHDRCVCHCLESFWLCSVKDLIALWLTGLERAG